MLKPYTTAKIMELLSILQTRTLRLPKNQNGEIPLLVLLSTLHLKCSSGQSLAHLQTCGL